MFRKTLAFLGTKIGISLIAAVAIVTSAFTLKNSDFFSRSTNSSESLVAEKVDTQKAFEKDSDNDGLKDWEEVLYGTDPNNPDTKGNGLGDLKEVEKLKSIASTSTDSIASTSTTTATDRFSREIFIRYLEAKKAGQEITPELSASIAEDVTSKAYAAEMPAFDEKILKTISTNNITFIRSYGNALWTAISVPVPTGLPNELVILEQIASQKTATDENIADLNAILGRYNKMRSGLVSMTVPLEARDAHAQLIQGIEILRDAVAGILQLDIDPIGALSKVKNYGDGVDIIMAANLRLKEYFKVKGLVFSTNGSGDIFVQ